MSESFSVVIVEDDPMVAGITRRLIASVPGFLTDGWFRTCAEALPGVPGSVADLVLLDVYLPDGSGTDLLQAWRGAGVGAHVVMITAAHDAATVEHALRFGAVDYLFKPYEPARLVEALHRFAAMRRALRPGTALSQSDFDRLQRPAAPVEAGLPKGITRPTLTLVSACLQQLGNRVSAQEVAQQLGLDRSTALRYLDYLCTTGKVIDSMIYGGVGRPTRLFQWAEA